MENVHSYWTNRKGEEDSSLQDGGDSRKSPLLVLKQEREPKLESWSRRWAVIWPPLPTHQQEGVRVQGQNTQGVCSRYSSWDIFEERKSCVFFFNMCFCRSNCFTLFILNLQFIIKPELLVYHIKMCSVVLAGQQKRTKFEHSSKAAWLILSEHLHGPQNHCSDSYTPC